MALRTGTGDFAMARATISSLNSQRSSILPPPRVTTITSTGGSLPRLRSPNSRIARAISKTSSATLNADRINEDLNPWLAAMKNLEKVANGRARRRGDHSQPSRKARQRALARGFEKSFSGQLALKRLELVLEVYRRRAPAPAQRSSGIARVARRQKLSQGPAHTVRLRAGPCPSWRRSR